MRFIVLGAFCVAFLTGCDFVEGLIHGGGGELPAPPAGASQPSPGHQLGEAAGMFLLNSPYGVLFGALLGALGLKGKQVHAEKKKAKANGG